MGILHDKRKKILSSVVCLSAILFAGCADTDDVKLAGKSSDMYPASYITLQLTSVNDNATRATAATSEEDIHPYGGENGDGVVQAQEYEYAVNRIVAFLYKEDGTDDDALDGEDGTEPADDEPDEDAEGGGMESSAGDAGNLYVTPIVFNSDEIDENNSAVGSDGTDYICVTLQKSVNMEPDKYKVLAIVNPSEDIISALVGDPDTENYKEDVTVKDILDYLAVKAWDASDGGYNNFLMSSANDNAELNLADVSGGGAVATVDVQRIAARVDYKAENNKHTTMYGGLGGKVTITGATLVNNLTSGSYMMKRVTSDVYDVEGAPSALSDEDITYFGSETITYGTNSSGDLKSLYGNYVIDPWTLVKTGSDPATETITNADGVALEYGNYYNGSTTEEQANPAYWEELVSGNSITELTESGETWQRVGYTMENTVFAPNTSKNYATGVVFQALFEPDASYVTSSFYGTTYSRGDTFFKWNDRLFATAEDMMSDWDSGFGTSNKYASVASMSSWSAIKTFANSLDDDDPTGYKKYLLEAAENGSDDDFDAASLTWEIYMADVLGYSCDGGTVSLGDDSAYLLANATNSGTSAYKDAKCYYIWWIRHANDNDDGTNGIMEYSIVRNNVYKLEVTSVSTLGGIVPTEGVEVSLSVYPWVYLATERLGL